MKKYISAVLIPCLLLQLAGCYSMEEVTREEFSPVPNYPKLLVKTGEKEITFNQGDYYLKNDTICGKGNCITINNVEEPFDGRLALADVNEIQREEFDEVATIALTTGVLLVVAADFIALYEASTWSMNFKWNK